MRLRFSLLLAAGCSASPGIEYGPPDGGAADDAQTGPADAASAFPPRLFLLNGASSLPYDIHDFRVCPGQDMLPARPSENRVPRTSYPGVPVGGFAEAKSATSWTEPAVFDAFGLGEAESNGPIACSELIKNGLYNKQKLGTVPAQFPGIIAIVDGPLDGGTAARVLSIAVPATAVLLPSVQLAIASPGLVSSFGMSTIGAGFGPLVTGTCPSTPFVSGSIELGKTLGTPVNFTTPSSYEDEGLTVCAAPLNGPPTVILQQSYLALQRVSAPDSVPSDFFKQRAYFAVVLVGEKGASVPALELHAVMVPFSVTM